VVCQSLGISPSQLAANQYKNQFGQTGGSHAGGNPGNVAYSNRSPLVSGQGELIGQN